MLHELADMFPYCESLLIIDLSNLKNVIDISMINMFSNCKSI